MKRWICFPFKVRRRVNGRVCEARDYSGKLRAPWENGCPRVIALHTSDVREATRRLLEERDKCEKRHRGIMEPAQHEEAAGKPLIGLLDAFLADMRAKRRSPRTVDKYADLAVLFRRVGWTRLRDVTARGFSQWLSRSRLSAKTANDYLANASRFLHWLQWQGMLGENPLQRVERVTREERQFRRALTDEERARLVRVAPQRRAAVYVLISETGLRRLEVDALRACDVVLDTPAPFIRVPGCIDKNNAEWDIPLRPHVVEAVRLLMPSDPLPFEHVFRGVVPRARVLRKDLAAAGIPFLDELGRRVDIHSLRATFGTNLVVAGVPPRVVMQLMRHRNMATTMKIYTDAKRLPLAAAVASLPAFTAFTIAKDDTQIRTQIPRPDAPADAQQCTNAHVG